MIAYKIYDKNINEELKIINSKMNNYKFKVKKIRNSYCITIHKDNKYYTTMIIEQTKIEVYRILSCINTFIRYKDK